jgi:hypothetical protein
MDDTVRYTCSVGPPRQSRSRGRGYGTRQPSLKGEQCGKWAGANLNRGYGHPKAEGYQATPPARIRGDGRPAFNASGPGSVAGVPLGVEVVVRHGDGVLRVDALGAETDAVGGPVGE